MRPPEARARNSRLKLPPEAPSPERNATMPQQVDPELHWFAFKVFYNRIKPLQRDINAEGVRTYVAMQVVETFQQGKLSYVEKPLIPSLLFVYATEAWIRDFKYRHESDFLCYSDPATRRPAPIADAEMKSFQILTSVRSGRKVEYLGVDAPQYRRGERVRVAAGLYKGVEGVIKRIKSDRKLLVCLSGVAVVAMSWMDPAYLEKLD